MNKSAATSENYSPSISQSWLTFLESKGGEIVGGQRAIFPQIQQEIPERYIIPCTQEAVICFEGKDVESFLQNQLIR